MDYFKNTPNDSFHPSSTTSFKVLPSHQIETSTNLSCLPSCFKPRALEDSTSQVNNENNFSNASNSSFSIPNDMLPLQKPNQIFTNQLPYGLESTNSQYNQFSTSNPSNEDGLLSISEWNIHVFEIM